MQLLGLRVGSALITGLSEDQLGEFEALMEAGDEAGAFAWLQSTRPQFKEVVSAEYDRLKTQIAESAPALLA